MQIKIIKDIKEAEVLWRALSPNETIYDDWDFRFLFYKHNPQDIFFYAGFENETPVALIPLQYDPEWNYLAFFGGDFMDSNRCFIQPGKEDMLPLMYQAIDRRTYLVDVVGTDAFTRELEVDDYSYFLPLTGLQSFEDFMQKSFNPKKRKNFRYLMREFESEKTPLRLSRNKADVIKRLFELNIKRHGEDSMLNYVPTQKALTELVSSSFDVKILSAHSEKNTESVYLGVLYNNTLFSLVVGSNNEEYSGLGNFMQSRFIDWAIELGARSFDAGLGDCGWKKHWHFEKEPQYEWKNF